MSTNYNNIETSYTNYYPSSQDIQCSHPPAIISNRNSNSISGKKQVKFSKTLTTVKKVSSKKWRASSGGKVTTSRTAETTAAVPSTDGTYYYYYLYENPDTQQQHQPAIIEEQQQQQQPIYNNNVAGNYYYYYTIDGASDANYNELLLQPAGNNENYAGQRIVSGWR